MFKKKFSKVWLILSVVACGAFVYFSNASIQYAEKTNTPLSELSNKDLQNYIQKYEHLINDISNGLHEKKYGFLLDYGVLPNEKIELIVKIPNKIENSTQQNIETIITDVIKDYKLDPNSFQITIENYYEPTENTSVRLSYNDLMGSILESMSEKNYGAFSINHNISPEKINVTINLTEDKTSKNIKKEVQQLVVDKIKQNDFDSTKFQIDITNNIISD